ncbi:phosphatidylinositol-binding clathrin assembly protein LAP-like isoform X2 [Amphiura filiformis]|uniref:phosphatidylinositol-binding clathrin assembly protein LAP-like isoform X2 n=1 Tax=Amphiura filiformis TaxID=82378 RepID=UPI003B21328D
MEKKKSTQAVQYTVEAMQYLVGGSARAPISMSGQSVLDRVTAAKHTITGSDLAKSVCKATTEEVMGPKKKHLDYLIQCTMTEHINIPELADTLTERTANASWVVVFKALVTAHHLMVYGHERFMRYMATRTVVFNLENFLDKTGVQGYDMSTYIRRYSKYLNQKALAYRTVAFDFCRVKRGKEEGVLRTMNTEKLLKTLPALQDSMDSLLAFDVTPNELTNGVINSGFMLLFKDSIRLFACYNDGIINLLEKYFEMNKKECKQALDIYKKFLIRMEKVGEFLKTAEQVGIDKGEIPDLAKFMDIPTEYKDAPSSLLEALEQHLLALEGKKGPAGVTTPTNKQPALVQSTVNAFSSVMAGVDEVEKKRAIEEEKARLAALKQPPGTAEVDAEERLREAQAAQQAVIATSAPTQNAAPAAVPATQPSNNPFMTGGAAPVTTNTDLFGVSSTTNNQSQSSALDDLMSLTPQVPHTVKQAQMGHPAMGAPKPWGSANGGSGMGANPGLGPGDSMFAMQQQPVAAPPPQMAPQMSGAGFTNNNDIGANFYNAFGMPQQGGTQMVNILQPLNPNQQQLQQQPNTEISNGTPLDSSLAQLASIWISRGRRHQKVS